MNVPANPAQAPRRRRHRRRTGRTHRGHAVRAIRPRRRPLRRAPDARRPDLPQRDGEPRPRPPRGPRRRLLGHGAAVVRPFLSSGAAYVPGATVWAVSRREDGWHELGVSTGAPGARQSQLVPARAVIIATGAQERPFPIPWLDAARRDERRRRAAAAEDRGRDPVPAGSCSPAAGRSCGCSRRSTSPSASSPRRCSSTTPRGRYAEAAAPPPGASCAPSTSPRA